MTNQKVLYPLTNPIKSYAWGHRDTLPALLHYNNPNKSPQAELWMGAHPQSPSTTIHQDQSIPLPDLLALDPTHFLGDNHGTSLPFLFKILAIKDPLSLQVHPEKALAEAGFIQENLQHIPLDDAKRTYKDSNDKTEMLYAYSDDVWALVGFRPYADTISDLQAIASPTLQTLLLPFSQNPSPHTLEQFLVALLTAEASHKNQILHDILIHKASLPILNDRWQWLSTLHQHYPQDIAILAPLYMNLLHLPKGDALFVPSGTLHAYLQGTGIEIMAASDNVVRFGLTEKYVDLASLSRVVTFDAQKPHILPASHNQPFSTPPCSFTFTHMTKDQSYTLPANNPAQIILVLNGSATITNPILHISYALNAGQSIFIPYNAGSYHIEHHGELFIATTYT